MKVRYERRKGHNPYSGLFSGPLTIIGETEYRKQWIANELVGLMEAQGVSRSELAKRMEVQPSRVTSMLSGGNNFTIETLVRAGRALGSDVEIRFVPAREDHGRKAEENSKVAENPAPYRTKNMNRKVAKPDKDRGGKECEA